MSEPTEDKPETGEFTETDFQGLVESGPTTAEAPDAKADDTKAEPATSPKDEPKGDEKPDGTPDKWRQTIDQRMAAIEKIAAKVEKGEASPKELASLQRQKDELEDILDEKRVENADFDAIKDQRTLAKRLLALEKSASEKLAQLDESTRKVAATQIWTEQKALYPDVNVKDVWKTALNDAEKEVLKEIKLEGVEYPDAVIRKRMEVRASTIYELRADAAQKSSEGKARPQTPKPTARTPSPQGTSGNGARVTTQANRSPGPATESTDPLEGFDWKTLAPDKD